VHTSIPLDIFTLYMKPRKLIIAIIFILLSACGGDVDSGSGIKAVYVKPSIDSRGRYRKGHVRMPVSTRKNALKSQTAPATITKPGANTGVRGVKDC
jgi:hypothetical protein